MRRMFASLCIVLGFATVSAVAQTPSVSFRNDIAPIIKKHCLPCHLADNENPSGLSLDDYETLMQGGEHGSIVTPGKPQESNLYLKLTSDPPFGRQMPRRGKKLTDDEVKLIARWISEGAKK